MASAKLLPMVAAALLCVVMAASSSWAHAVPHRHHLTKTEKIAYYHRIVHHDRQQIRKANTVFRFFEHHTRLLANAATKSVAWQEVSKWQAIKKKHTAQMRFAQKRLALLTVPLWPPHHDLWLCIHNGEGRWDDPNSGGNGHYGGLQMTPGWGELPSGATANSLSQFQQEWLAEREGAKNSFSSSWLWQQWGADAHCFS